MNEHEYLWNTRRPRRDHGVVTTLVYLLSMALMAYVASWWLL